MASARTRRSCGLVGDNLVFATAPYSYGFDDAFTHHGTQNLTGTGKPKPSTFANCEVGSGPPAVNARVIFSTLDCGSMGCATKDAPPRLNRIEDR